MQTPADLIQEGLYTALALALHPPPFRHVSACLIARALGASKAVGVAGLKAQLSIASSSRAPAKKLAQTAVAKQQTKPGLAV